MFGKAHFTVLVEISGEWGEVQCIEAKSYFLFCKGGSIWIYLWDPLAEKIIWMGSTSPNTIYILMTPKLTSPPWISPLNSKLIYQTVHQTSPLGNPHFKRNKWKHELVFWTGNFLFQTCSSNSRTRSSWQQVHPSSRSTPNILDFSFSYPLYLVCDEILFSLIPGISRTQWLFTNSTTTTLV